MKRLLTTLFLCGLATQATADIELQDHLQGVEDYFDVLIEDTEEMQAMPAPSMSAAARASRELEDVMSKYSRTWEGYSKDEVDYGLGQKNSVTRKQYMDQYGNDKSVLNAAKHMGDFSLKGDGVEGAKRWSRNITIPFSDKTEGNEEEAALKKAAEDEGEEYVPREDKDKAVLRHIRQAGMSTAQYALQGMIARREGNPSFMEFAEDNAIFRFRSDEWLEDISTASDSSLLREIIHIMALELWLQHQSFLQSERMEMLMAASLGLQNQVVEAVQRTESMTSGNAAYAPKKASPND